jgi:S1-C subfamily serine protease
MSFATFATNQQMTFISRLALLALGLCLSWFGAKAQPPERTIRTQAALPSGLVYVSQKIDLREQLSAEETIFSLDGEPVPQLQTTSVTLGLLLDAQGHIVTRLANIAPQAPAPQLMVYLTGGRLGQFPANFVGMDSVTGLCVLKAENLPADVLPATTKSAAPPLGAPPQRAIQLFGFNPKQRGGGTRGIAFIRPRILPTFGAIKKAVEDFRYSTSNPIYHLIAPTTLTPVQDCSVAVEKDGSVLGLVAYDTSGEEIHLVYPLNRIQQLAVMIIEHKRFVVPHAWLGATSGGHDPQALVKKTASINERGVLIAAVFPDSPAEMAGMRPHDLLVSISGRSLFTGADLSSTLRLLPADSEVTLKVRRGNEFKLLPARLAPAPALDAKQQLDWMVRQKEEYERRAQQLPENDPNRQKNESKAKAMQNILGGITNAAPPEIWVNLMYGVEVIALTPQLAKSLAAPGGVLVSRLSSSSKCAQAGVKIGDVIVKIGEEAVADSASLKQALSQEKAEAIEFLIVRQGQSLKLNLAK